MTPHIGCCGFGANKAEYFKQLRCVEYQQTFRAIPRSSTLRGLRHAAPAGFEFVVKAWRRITHAEADGPVPASQLGHFRATDEVQQAWSQVQQAAEILEAQVVVFETPADFTPTAAHREQMTRFFQDHQPYNHTMVWQPRGLWSEPAVAAICDELGLVAARDPLAQPDSDVEPQRPVTYLRISALSTPLALTEDQLATVASSLQTAPHGYCLFDTPHKMRDALRLQELLEVL